MNDFNGWVGGHAPTTMHLGSACGGGCAVRARAGLTGAVVIGPGKAILFYGRHSVGEGLGADGAGDAAFLLVGVGAWVGGLSCLATNLVTVQEGRGAVAQAVR